MLQLSYFFNSFEYYSNFNLFCYCLQNSECKNDIPVVPQPTTRGGLRVYKIVVLGEGGVGKSGKV